VPLRFLIADREKNGPSHCQRPAESAHRSHHGTGEVAQLLVRREIDAGASDSRDAHAEDPKQNRTSLDLSHAGVSRSRGDALRVDSSCVMQQSLAIAPLDAIACRQSHNHRIVVYRITTCGGFPSGKLGFTSAQPFGRMLAHFFVGALKKAAPPRDADLVR